VEFLRCLAQRARGRTFLHVNSTRHGGGVAEILHRLLPIMTDLGVDTRWEVIKGDAAFYSVTKAFHNALQGQDQAITKEMLDVYAATNTANARDLSRGDLVLIHDPQPAPLIEHRPGKGKWVWRCHIDLSNPQREAWRLLRKYVAKYDAAVFSLPRFAKRLYIPQFLVYPSIDPLSEKNRDLSEGELNGTLERLGIPRDKPILLQVSRFDRFGPDRGDDAQVVKSKRTAVGLAGAAPTTIPRGPRSGRGENPPA
jgi:trehalose synthase